MRQGMALLCMTRPVSDVIVETQSDWGYSLGVGDWKGPSGHIRGMRHSAPQGPPSGCNAPEVAADGMQLGLKNGTR